ncbi:MAG: MFS transporter [Johnsonella sp.]|nr:MFS transporter [Johnsonella sp.]
MDSKFKKYFTIIALGISGGSIYFLPFIKYVFYDAQIEAMNIANTQSAFLVSIYGIANTILYIPGGMLADKFKPKKVLIISLIATGLLGLLYAFTFDYNLAVLIWIGLSFSTAFIFWSSLMKAVRIVGTEEEQGFMYGVYYACNGVSAAVVQFLALFAYNTAKGNVTGGFFRAIVVGAIAVIFAAVLLIFLMDDKKKIEEDEGDKFNFRDAAFLLRQPIIWFFSFIVMAGYGYYSCISYFTPYLTEVKGVSATVSGAFSIIRNYVFLLLSPLGGLLADKVFKSTSKWLAVGFTFVALTFIGVLLLPNHMNGTLAGIYTLLPGAVAMMVYGVIFSALGECGIPRVMTGTAIGLASIIGYLPDTIYNMIFGRWLDAHGGGGYTYIFIFLAISGFIGAILSVIVSRRRGKNIIPGTKQ